MEENRPNTNPNTYGNSAYPNGYRPTTQPNGYNAARPAGYNGTPNGYRPASPYGYGANQGYQTQNPAAQASNQNPVNTQQNQQQPKAEEPLVREMEKPVEQPKKKKGAKKFALWLGFLVSLAAAIGLVILFITKK